MHTGTSASAPLAAGIFALVLQAKYDSRPTDSLIYTLYRVGQNKLNTAFFAITLSTLNRFSYFLAHIHYRKFATGRCIVRPPNTVYVATLPCKILNHNFTDILHIYYH